MLNEQDDEDADHDDRFFHQLSATEQVAYLKAWLDRSRLADTDSDRNGWERKGRSLSTPMVHMLVITVVAILYYGFSLALFRSVGYPSTATDYQALYHTLSGICAFGTGAVLLTMFADIFEWKANKQREEKLIRLLRRISERDQERPR